MHPAKRIVVRWLAACAFLVLLSAGPCPGGVQAAVPGGPGLAGERATQGGGSFFPFQAGESAAVKGITDAGRKISENVDFLGGEMTGLLGGWAGQNAFLSVTYVDLLTSLVLLLIVLMVNRVARTYIDGRIRDLPGKNGRFAQMASFWDAVSRPLSLFVLIYGVFLALAPVLVELGRVQGLSKAYLVAGKAADFAGSIAIFWFIYRLVNVMEAFLRKKALGTETELDDTLVPLLGRTARACIVVIGTAIVVKSLTGLDFGPLLASLGIGGMAVAFAAKDSIGNFLGSLTILFDKPFTVGDRIVLEGRDGVVEELGFRSTRIRTAGGSLVSIPNEKIVNTLVENAGRKPGVKWHATLSLAWSTPPEKVERAVEIVRAILKDHEGMKPDQPPRVHFTGFGDRTLNLTVMAWYHAVPGSSYEEWLQGTCLAILKSFEDEGIVLVGGRQG